ncbi:translation elongation factor Ts [Spiroplasma endosymbiont of Amphibalanus improvisus]|uniref:translation elongation factor Ts n=1 Tax=Spiroplasma endosymbiont of Amphibalanus improvisus TaxID=3066327 RepID=UPI00313D2C07
MAIKIELIKQLRETTGSGMMDCKKALEETGGNLDEAFKWLREKGIAKAAKKSARIAAEGIVKIIENKNKIALFELNTETDFVAQNKQFIELTEKVAKLIIANDTCDVSAILKLKDGENTLEDTLIQAAATIGEKISLRRVEMFTKSGNETFGAYTHFNNRSASILLFDNKIDETAVKNVAMHVTAMDPKFISTDNIDNEFKKNEKEIILNEIKNDPVNSKKPTAILERMVEGRLNKQFMTLCLLSQKFVLDESQTVEQFLNSKKVKLLKMARFEVGQGIEKQEVDFAAEVAQQMKNV